MKILSRSYIEELRKFDTPTVSNAIERFKIRKKTEGFMDYTVRLIFPEMKSIVGYACTAKISSLYPPTNDQQELLYEYYQLVLDTPNPTIAVIQDNDPNPTGSFWGEVQVNVHRALGCVGTITNGGVRDIDEVKDLNFSYFASCVLVSHAYVHLEQIGKPVVIGNLIVRQGDILHADKHGVVLIPSEIADEIVDACKIIQEAEKPFIKKCKNVKNGDITVDQIREWRKEMVNLRDGGIT